MNYPNNYPAIAKTHWDLNEPTNRRCNFPINYSFSFLKAFEASDGTTTHKMYMLRDPSDSNANLGSFNGTWTQTAFAGQATMSANVETLT